MEGTNTKTTRAPKAGLNRPLDLAVSTSLTASFCSTPFTKDEWTKFYAQLDPSLQKATTQDPKYDSPEVQGIAQGILDIVAGCEEFKGKKFDRLSNEQKGLLEFMILKEMHTRECFHTQDHAAHALIKVLYPESKEYKRMLSFIHRGGDLESDDIYMKRAKITTRTLSQHIRNGRARTRA